jgi:hypothetical protein
MVLSEAPKQYGLIKEQFAEEVTMNDINKIKYLNSLLQEESSSVVTNKTSTGISKSLVNDYTSLYPISNDLQLLISTYGGLSYKGSGGVLYNIAKNINKTKDITSTAQGVISTRDFTFDEQESSYSEAKGLFLGNNRITGPMSMNLGISGNGEFTIFLICRHDELSLGKSLINIFKIYSNTPNNNGLSFNIENITTSPVQSGNLTLTFDAQKFTSDLIPIDPNVVYLYVIQKRPASLKLTVYSTINPNPVDVIYGKMDTSDVLLSNRNMCINCFSNWYSYLRAFGIYNVALDTDRMKQIAAYMTSEESKLLESYKQFQDKLKLVQDALDKLKKCPYDTTTCGQCPNIKDWSNMNEILQAEKTCKSAIDKYCLNNPTKPICECWNPKSDLYNTVQCSNYRNIFKQVVDVNVKNLDPKTLEDIKKEYKLDVCKSTSKPSELLTVTDGKDTKKDVKPQTAVKTETCPAPKNPNILVEPVHPPVKPTFDGFLSWLTSWF